MTDPIARLRTAGVSVGDIVSTFHPLLGTHIGVEHWDQRAAPARKPPRRPCSAATAYDRMPYFYTDQYDLDMEYAGYAGPGGYDRVVFRGDVGKREFTAFCCPAAGWSPG